MSRIDPAIMSRLKSDLGGIRMDDNPGIVRQKSRDFYWYSPVLKRQLGQVAGDLVVTPRNEDEIARVLAACYALDVPVTARGAGTGNYGQSMPLAGGVILSLADIADIRAISPGRVVAGPGAVIAAIDRATRPSGQELRLHPSTAATATIGGFLAGGSSGVGSVRWGGLRDLGNVVRLRVLTMEPAPRALDLAGWDLHKVLHAYGTNGIISEVEMPLTAACDWVDLLLGFDSWPAAAGFGAELAAADGILVKLVSAIAAPLPYDYFTRHRRFLAKGQSVVVAMAAPHAVDAVLALGAQARADIRYRSDRVAAAERRELPPAYELAWNHTTLRGLKIDPTITYLQVLYPGRDPLAKVSQLTAVLGDEVPGHIEFARYDGGIGWFGLPVVRFSTEARLGEIIRLHEDAGCPVFDPHRYTLEAGGMRQTDDVQLAFKREADPKGLLNPGKMEGWDAPELGRKDGRVFLFPGRPAN